MEQISRLKQQRAITPKSYGRRHTIAASARVVPRLDHEVESRGNTRKQVRALEAREAGRKTVRREPAIRSEIMETLQRGGAGDPLSRPAPCEHPAQD